MHAQAPHRRAGSAAAALGLLLLLSAAPAHAAAAAQGGDHAPAGRSQDGPPQDGPAQDGPAQDGPGEHGERPSDRPPPHAGGTQDAPPPHAHSPAPEDRPPAHARARRASARHAGDGSPAGGSQPGRDRSAPPGRSDRPAPAPAPQSGRGTELDTDVVDEDATRPLPDRRPAAVTSPVVAAVSPVAAPDPQPPTPPSSTFAPTPSGDELTSVLPRDVAPGADPRPTPDVLAAPPPHTSLELFAAEDVARRVVVPVLLLVAGLIYLLAQGRIDRRGLLLTAPEVLGTEDDDDVFEL